MQANRSNATRPKMDGDTHEITNWIVTSIVIDGLVIAANIIELRLLIGKWKKLDRIEHLLFSLCLSDLFHGLFAFVLDSLTLRQVLDTGSYTPGELANLVLDSLLIFSILLNVFHVTAIAVERLVAVIFPVGYSVFTTFACKCLTISLIWSISFVLATSFALLERYANDTYTRGSILLICSIIVFSAYMLLVAALVRRELQLKEMIPKEIRKHTRDRRTTIICLFIGFSFVVCVVPYCLAEFFPELYHPIRSMLITINHLINPVIYFSKTIMESSRKRSGSTGSILLSHSNMSNNSSMRT